MGGGDTTIGEGFIEVLTEVGQGNREKRQPFVFDSSRDSLKVTRGANAASLAKFFGELLPEQYRAFHGSPFWGNSSLP
jgi:hypothetical protein